MYPSGGISGAVPPHLDSRSIVKNADICATVVVPVFNRADLLESVLQGLLQQSRNDFEVIVCDDGSTEDISSVVSKYSRSWPSLRYIRQENSGPAAARNLGIRHASGPVVVFFDSDIILSESTVEELVCALSENPDWYGVEGAVEPIEGESNILWDAPINQTGGVYLTAAIAYRKESLVRVGGFDESFPMAACEDVELAARVMKLGGEIGFCRRAVVFHPRRQRTVGYFWKRRRAWISVVRLALRHGFVGWPGNRTAHPRLRTVYCAVVSQPVGRAIEALTLTIRSPIRGLRGMVHAIAAWIAGASVVPAILLADAPIDIDYLERKPDCE